MLKQLLLTDLEPGLKKVKVNTRFSSDKRNKDFLERAKKATQKALGSTFSGAPEKDESLPEKLKKNIMTAFLKEFVYSLEFYKLIDGNIKFHIIVRLYSFKVS